MKKIIVLVGCFITLTSVCFAQDVIVTRDSRKINAIVTEVNVDDVRYKHFDSPNGTTYMLQKSDVVAILYQNGKVETFDTENARTQPSTSAPAQAQNQRTTTPVQLQSQRTTAPTQTPRQRISNSDLIYNMQFDEPILYQQYMSGKRQNKVSNFLFIPLGVLITVPGIVCWIAGYDGHTGDSLTEAGIAMTVTGSVLLTTGITMKSIARKKVNNSLDTYRRMYYSDQSAPYIQFKLYGNGLGLAYVF